ncbi:MAG: hypothetical protein M0Z30_17335 [Actinomycetota bacterium]|nr:hypothetical protein [Actinomycetota bacterium]
MSNSTSSTNGAIHVVVGAMAAGVSHLLVPVRNWFDYLLRALVGVFLSAVALNLVRAA